MDNPRYKITEQDIQAMLKHLRHVAPDHATPEKAIHLLERRSNYFKAIEELQPKKIEEALQDFESN